VTTSDSGHHSSQDSPFRYTIPAVECDFVVDLTRADIAGIAIAVQALSQCPPEIS
jgi:hypothetical protein